MTVKQMNISTAEYGVNTLAYSKGTAELDIKRLCAIAALAALIQLACTLLTVVIAIAVGTEPTTAQEYFAMLGQNRLVGLLRMDFPSLINAALFGVTGFALYFMLKEHGKVMASFGTAIIFVAVGVAFAKHPSFSMIYLSDQYAAAASDAQRAVLLAAGEGVLASNWWNSFGGFITGLCLQGGMVLLSIVMLRSRRFGRVTAYSGMLANGLDWLHVIANLFLPAAGTILLSIGGLFYLVWFPLLARDLLRLARQDRGLLPQKTQ